MQQPQLSIGLMYLLFVRRKYQHEEDVDAPDESTLDCGKEWPDFENPDVARYRRFYQVGALLFLLHTTTRVLVPFSNKKTHHQ